MVETCQAIFISFVINTDFRYLRCFVSDRVFITASMCWVRIWEAELSDVADIVRVLSDLIDIIPEGRCLSGGGQQAFDRLVDLVRPDPLREQPPAPPAEGTPPKCSEIISLCELPYGHKGDHATPSQPAQQPLPEPSQGVCRQ